MLKKKPVVAEEVVSWAIAYRTQRDRGAGSAPLRADSYDAGIAEGIMQGHAMVWFYDDNPICRSPSSGCAHEVHVGSNSKLSHSEPVSGVDRIAVAMEPGVSIHMSSFDIWDRPNLFDEPHPNVLASNPDV